jgi:hypothetical protein
LPEGKTFCERWKALGPGDLPSFATDSECEDYSGIATNDVPCSGAANADAKIRDVLIAQNHLLPPSAEDYTKNDSGASLVKEAVRPKFRMISHRPALLMVSVTGSGTAPEVKVTATRNGATLGSLCLKGPDDLPTEVDAKPSAADRFTVSMPAAWIRSGIELEISAGGATRKIPATDLRVGGGVRHLLVEASMMMYGDTTVNFVPKKDPDTYVMADELPAQSVIWAHFPVPIEFNPFTMGGNPPRALTVREGSFDEVGECLDMMHEIRRANGHVDEAAYYASLDSRNWGGGLGGTNGAAGPASQLMIRHEGGHAYGLPHMEDGYRELKYPFAKRTNGTGCVLGVPNEDGCGVGTHWKYFQTRNVFESPWEGTSTSVYKRDPMAGGGNNWFGEYTDQWVLDYLQKRVYWDDEENSYMRYDAASGEFVKDTTVTNGGYYGRPAERDVPVYTLFGAFSNSTPAVNVIQKPLHYRGGLPKTMDPTKAEDLNWLKSNRGKICNNGCDFVLRVSFGSTVRTYLVNRTASDYTRWAINIKDEGAITKVELLQRAMRNNTGGNIGDATPANYLESAKVVAQR